MVTCFNSNRSSSCSLDFGRDAPSHEERRTRSVSPKVVRTAAAEFYSRGINHRDLMCHLIKNLSLNLSLSALINIPIRI